MRIDRHLLIDFAQVALVKAGAEAKEALKKAELLVWCDQVGRETQGVWRLPMIIKRLQKKLHNSPCHLVFEQVSSSQCRLDGDAGLGYYVAAKAMEKAIALAAEQGIGCVAVRNASHLGAAAYYVKQAADANMIGLCFSNSLPRVIPPGGDKSVWGTNPVAIGCPRKSGQHVLIDMATAASSGSAIQKAAQLQQPVAEGVMVDTGGNPSQSAEDLARGGSILPMAGAKGFGLGLAVEILSAVLTGAGITKQLRSMHTNFDGPANNGHLMLALAIEPLMPLDIFFQRLEGLIDEVHKAGKQGAVRIPGELRWREYEKSLEQGVYIDESLRVSMEQLATSLSIEYPW